VGGGVGDPAFKGGKKKMFPSKAPRQCPLILLVEVRLTETKALGSEKVKF
jgi:hypothetical protein